MRDMDGRLTTWERLKIAFALAQIGFCVLEIYRISARRRG
jgi:hypothetical protein